MCYDFVRHDSSWCAVRVTPYSNCTNIQVSTKSNAEDGATENMPLCACAGRPAFLSLDCRWWLSSQTCVLYIGIGLTYKRFENLEKFVYTTATAKNRYCSEILKDCHCCVFYFEGRWSEVSYVEVLRDKSTMYIRVTSYWGYLIVIWLFYLVCILYCGCFNLFCNVWVSVCVVL